MAETLRISDTSGRASPQSSRKLFVWGFGAGLLVCLAAGQAWRPNPPADPEAQLESAIYRESVRGDLKGALEQYRAVALQPAGSRAVAARSLLQMARCLERLGQSKEAQSTYARIVREFGDQPAIAAEARLVLAPRTESGPRNLGFQQGLAGKTPPGWLVNGAAELRRAGCRSGIGCAVVMGPPNSAGGGNLMQSFGAAPYKGKMVRLRAWLRLEASGPDDRAQMWLRVDRANWPLGFLDVMDDRPVRSAEWTRCEIVSRVFDDATTINVGVISAGGGRVWVDDVSFEVVQ